MAENSAEYAEVSAAKNAVWNVLDDYLDPDEYNLIVIADRVVNDLTRRGVLIPDWFPDPHNGNKPAQGYHPTSSQVEKWQGRAVSPVRVTGR